MCNKNSLIRHCEFATANEAILSIRDYYLKNIYFFDVLK